MTRRQGLASGVDTTSHPGSARPARDPRAFVHSLFSFPSQRRDYSPSGKEDNDGTLGETDCRAHSVWSAVAASRADSLSCRSAPSPCRGSKGEHQDTLDTEKRSDHAVVKCFAPAA